MKPHKIEAIYAWIVVHDNGEDGIPAIQMPDGMIMPLISSDKIRLKELTVIAKQNHALDGKEWRLVKFSHPEVVAVLPAEEANVTH